MAGGVDSGRGGGARPSDKAAENRPMTAIDFAVQSIKEVVHEHSDDYILEALRESIMDPNETAHKLLNEDLFVEVKRKKDKKIESPVQKTFAETSAQGEHGSQWTKPHPQRGENDQRRAHNQGQTYGPSREFRIVRDNRHGAMENRSELGHKGSTYMPVSERSGVVGQSEQNHPPPTNSYGQITHQSAKNSFNSDMCQTKREAQGTSQRHPRPYLKNSQNEHQLPNSDPAYASSNFKATGGSVGANRRDAGVSNAPRQYSGRACSQLHAPNDSYHANIQRGNFASAGPSGHRPPFMPRNSQPNHRPSLDTVSRGRYVGRSYGNQNINRYQHGTTSNPKATQPAKECKPKSTNKSFTKDADNSGTDAVSPLDSSTENAKVLDVNNLHDKTSHSNMHKMKHVIIPEHLRVPEYEQTRLRFGSFTPTFDSDQLPTSTSPEPEQAEQLGETVQLVVQEDTFGSENDEVDEQTGSQLAISTSGYGNYTHPAGDTISSPGVIGTGVGFDDVNWMKYNDNNIYVPTPQDKMAVLPAPDMTIIVSRGLHPFSHVEEQAREIFGNHLYAEELLHESHSHKLANFTELKELGPHRLLNRQTTVSPPSRWINFKIKAKDTDHWIMPFLRDDNVYVRGFANRHNAHEMTQPLFGEGRVPMSSIQLPQNYNCVLLNWDVTYPSMFGCKDKDVLEVEFQKLLEDEDSVFNAVCFLSNYVHVEGSADEIKARKMLAGIIFHMCEYFRMNLRSHNGRLIDWIHHWGGICMEYLKWKDRDFTDWIGSRVPTDPPTNKWVLFKNLGIRSPADGLGTLCLVLNRDITYFDNLEKNRSKISKIKVKGSDEGGKGNQRQRKIDGGSNMGEKGNRSQETKDSSNSKQNGQSSAHGCDQCEYSQGDPMEENTAKDSLSFGRRRVQILKVSSNFEIEWIDFFDWHRPQAIYRRKLDEPLIEPINDGLMKDLPLIGPARPIGAYAGVGLEVCPSWTTDRGEKRRRANLVINERGAIVKKWTVDNDGEELSFHCKKVDGMWEGQKLKVCYMLVPNTVEARIEVKLLLTGGHYHVRGQIKAWNRAMGNYSVKLLSSDQMVEVSSGLWTPLPLMVSLICLDNTEDVELSIAAYLTLSSCSNSGNQSLIVPPYECFKLNRTAATQEREVRGNKIAMAVNFTT